MTAAGSGSFGNDFEQLWKALAPIGRDDRTGGYRRYSWTPAHQECERWFRDEAGRRDLTVEADGNGNLVAWWRPDPARVTGGVVTGSHLDSVPDGGAYDGPLGVVSAFAALDAIRAGGAAAGAGASAPTRPLGIAVFAEEEGARFGVPCLGSRLLTGALEPDRARGLRDADGVPLTDAMERAGVPVDLGPAPGLLRAPSAFVELHVEQGRALADLGAPVAVARDIWPHGRWRFEFGGRADHAGTTAMADRHDPMLTYAMTALAANKRARLTNARTTFGRVRVEPNATNAVPSLVRAWLDARAADEASLDALVEEIRRQAGDRAQRDGTRLEVHPESWTPRVEFDVRLRDRVAARLGSPPVLSTQAGHDAGILAAAGIPAAMLFVRNPTGVSHAPEEYAEPADCLAGVDALAAVLTDLLAG
ncbi:N-carbamoyl-L-amino-acid hydrolase [Actinopolymorpha cephalotaxi]|uniref:N-carbamoyl-L-amino-acid hydrolase n=1 Tax=Actinopolymorpha cephalotaxi TaxID=504797 RepID=A0A1I3BV99_9ACTN|nr:allantoate amidohydrolase [Actinopolymorpha cephalotaxi]NYH86292.1 N-carbamoyl-L-amino-acid hydrolase [Actinopolymorpha cephalotaxi]SFH66006.1 N-carbamoyl-L-amino-acid hydrolase [Actinopolymorpha cephalotaxi]